MLKSLFVPKCWGIRIFHLSEEKYVATIYIAEAPINVTGFDKRMFSTIALPPIFDISR